MDATSIVGRDPATLLPHGRVFLFVDEIVACTGTSIETARTVPFAEPWTDAHFPGDPIVPGVLLLEGMVQTCGLLARAIASGKGGRRGMLTGVRAARFLAPARPGQRLTYVATYVLRVGAASRFDASARVGGKLIADASVSVVVDDEDRALERSV